MSQINDFFVECSDNEEYENNDNNYLTIVGKRVWQPNGQQIATLYQQLEIKGFIELRWQCPGRRSPSVHNIHLTDLQKTEISDNETNVLEKSSYLLNEFDFDTECNFPNIASKFGAPKRQRQPGPEKVQTNLNKVMADIKKYQIQEHQIKRQPDQSEFKTS